MFKKNFAILVFIVLAFSASGQHALKYPVDAINTRYAVSQPVVRYILRVDTNNLSGFDVEIQIKNAPKTFHLAMGTHKEYDDRYWRYVENFKVESKKNSFKRADSALWTITTSSKEVVVKYRIHLPPLTDSHRPVWKPFLSSTGGLVGDIHSFMYVVEQPNISSLITFELPEGWQIATGLEPTKDPKIFYAENAKTLMDCPVLIGKFETWNFSLKNIPHKIVYWSKSNATSFDKSILVNNIKKIVDQTIQLFGTAPYKHYTFLLQDAAYGALEHSNSVTIGIPSETFERDITQTNNEIAHEYFHTWNLMAIRPAEYTDLNYGHQEKASGVWWSEGLSLFYADLLARHAGLATYEPTRIIHLEKLIERFSNSGYAKISPEKSSLESNAQPGGLGDYNNISVHLQGEVIGAMLDLIIRDATNGKHSIDDVMKKMFYKFSGTGLPAGRKGFYSKDIEQTVKDICKYNIHSFFESYLYRASPMDFNRYLKLIGKQVNVTWRQRTDENGKAIPDWQINIYRPVNDTGYNILIYNPESCWAKAGLHTNDKVFSVNEIPITNTQTFRDIQRKLQVGDKIIFSLKRKSGIENITVNVTGYNVPVASITSLKNITEKQRMIFKEWNK